MRSDTSVKRTLVAALLAAGLWPASALLLGPALGLTNALGVHLVGALALHVATLEAHATRRFARGLAALLLGACVLALAPAMPERGIGLALVLVMSTTGLCPLTVTDSSIAPTFMLSSTRAVNPTVNLRSSRMSVLKPASSNFSV